MNKLPRVSIGRVLLAAGLVGIPILSPGALAGAVTQQQIVRCKAGLNVATAAKSDLDGKFSACNDVIQSGRVSGKELATAYSERGAFYFFKHDFDRAIADFDEAIRLDPKRADTLRAGGSTYAAKHDYDRAIADFDEAIRLEPFHANAYLYRGWSYEAKSDRAHARKDYNDALEIVSDNDDDRETLQLAKKSLEHLATAESGVVDAPPQKAAPPITGQPQPAATAGLTVPLPSASSPPGATERDYANCQQATDIDLSIAACTQVINDQTSTVPDRAFAYGWRANGYVAFKALDKAISDYNEAIRLDPKNAHTYASRAIAYLRSGDRDHAVADYQAADAIDHAKIAEMTASNPELQTIASLTSLNNGQVAVASPPSAPAVQSDPCGGASTVRLSYASPRPACPLTAAEEHWLNPKDTFKECSTCPEMVVVPAGSFTMGSPANEQGRRDDEGPQHDVSFKRAFAVGKFEITVDQFATFVKEVNYDTGATCATFEEGKFEERQGRSWRNPGFPQTDSHPAVCLNWNDAKAYVRWLSQRTGKDYRLLTEAEYEYATRARTTPGQAPRYFFGDNEASMCRYGNGADQTAKRAIPGADKWEAFFSCDDGYPYTAPVGSFAPNAFGLYDMHGNAYTWIEDCWHGGYSGAPTDGSSWAGGGSDCYVHVVRGGSWYNNPAFLRSALRNLTPANLRYTTIGLRVARTLTP